MQWRAEATLGLLALEQGDAPEAEQHLALAVSILEARRSSLSGEAAQAFLLGHDEVYEALVDVRLLRGDTLGAFVVAQQLQLAELPAPPVEASSDPSFVAFQRLQDREAWLQQALEQEAHGAEDD